MFDMNKMILHNYDVLDLAHLSRQTLHDKKLEAEILRLFVSQSLKLSQFIAASNEIKAQSDAAHTLLGSARAVGAVRVTLALEALETALKQGGRALSFALADLDASVSETNEFIRNLALEI
jgi:HPt (histidine-containing phosphotransfer) domain-containing protein